MAKTAQRKAESPSAYTISWSANTAYSPGALIFDDLTFTLATGDWEFLTSAIETIRRHSLDQARAARRI